MLSNPKMVRQLKRWAILNKVFLIGLVILIFFAWMDAKQIITFHRLDSQEAWDLYNTYTGPAIWTMWYFVFLTVGIIWYLFSKDLSEAIGLTGALWIMEWFGTQDLFFFLFSEQSMTASMCWVGIVPVNLISDFLGETCPSPFAFKLAGFLGMVIGYIGYKKLKEAGW